MTRFTLPGFNAASFQKYFKNTSWLMLARVGSLLIKMLVNGILLPNYLGDSLFGTYNYAWTFLAFFVGVCTVGTDGLVTRELLQRPQLRDDILGSAFRLRLIGGLVALPLVYISYLLVTQISVEPPAASFSQIAIVSVICLAQSTQIIDSYFQSKAQGKTIMYVQVGGNILSALIKLVLILMGASITVLVGTLVLDILFFQIGYLLFYRKEGLSVFNWNYRPRIALYLLRKGWPLALSAIFVSLYMRIDQMMIDAMLGAAQLGVYSTVVQLSEAWYFIPVAISTALFPPIMNFRKTDKALYHRRMNNFYELLVVLSILIAIGVTVMSPYVYDWFYGTHRPEYLVASPVLQVHIWAGVFVFLGTGSAQYLIAEGLTKIAFTRTMFGAIANVLLNLVFIPRYGIMGAAYATILAYATATLSILFFRDTRRHGWAMVQSLFLLHSLRNFISRKIK